MYVWIVWRTNGDLQGVFSSREKAVEAVKARGDDDYHVLDQPLPVDEMFPHETQAATFYWPIQDAATNEPEGR